MITLFRRSPRPGPVDDWYERATPEAREEYNAFGPWVQEIRGREGVPPCFLPWFSELEHASLVIKIPVNQERRDARPGQDLYRAIVAVCDDHLVLLSLEAGKVECRLVPLAEVQALRNFHVLLQAEFGVFLRGGTSFLCSYNAVSLPLIDRILDVLGAKISGKSIGASVSIAAESEDFPVKDHYFRTLVREHRLRHPGSVLVFCEEPGVRYRDHRRRNRSLGLLVLKTANEWLFLDRGSALRQTHDTAYAGSTTWVPFSRTPSFRISDPDALSPQGGRTLSVHIEGHTLDYRVFTDPARLNEFLSVLKNP